MRYVSRLISWFISKSRENGQQKETQTKNICFTYFLLAIICTRYLFIKCFIYSYVYFLLFQDAWHCLSYALGCWRWRPIPERVHQSSLHHRPDIWSQTTHTHTSKHRPSGNLESLIRQTCMYLYCGASKSAQWNLKQRPQPVYNKIQYTRAFQIFQSETHYLKLINEWNSLLEFCCNCIVHPLHK